MWWNRKFASRSLRLHRLKSTGSTAPREPEQSLGIIGVPFAKGQAKQGVELAPDLLRQSSLRQVLQSSHGESATSLQLSNFEMGSATENVLLDFENRWPRKALEGNNWSIAEYFLRN